jgi:hypothetical protein
MFTQDLSVIVSNPKQIWLFQYIETPIPVTLAHFNLWIITVFSCTIYYILILIF